MIHRRSQGIFFMKTPNNPTFAEPTLTPSTVYLSHAIRGTPRDSFPALSRNKRLDLQPTQFFASFASLREASSEKEQTAFPDAGLLES